MPDNHYADPRLARLYDVDSPWSADREFYLGLASRPGRRILDLGCGTGLLCDAYAANGHLVTGLDPAPAMLEIARRKSHAHRVDWVEGSAQAFELHREFDLIVMTGHAFQVLLEDADVAAAFDCVRRHLARDGIFAFESRNPAIDWRGEWNYELPLPGTDVVESRRWLAMNGGRLTFELRYEFADHVLFSKSELRFWSKDEIERHLAAAGLRIDRLYGDWSRSPFAAARSEEMIFLAKKVDTAP